MEPCPTSSSAAERRRAHPASIVVLVLSLLVLGLVGLADCGSTSTTASSSPGAATTAPSASPSTVPAAQPVSQWDAPGTASLAQTQAVTRRYAAALSAKKIPEAGLYASGATWDIPTSDQHAQGAAAIESLYRDLPSVYDWSKKGHQLAGPGVGVDEGVFTIQAEYSTPSMSLLAVDGNKIVHEEIFLNEGTSPPVTFFDSAPGPKDTAKVAAQVGAAVGEAFAAGDQAALKALVAPDVLFRDIAQAHGVRGWDAMLAWWDRVPTVTLHNKKPVAGPGWAVVRWTMRQDFPTGVEVAMPGATVMEVRGGKVVRMTLYYNSWVMRLQT